MSDVLTLPQIQQVVRTHFSSRATTFDSEPTHDLKSPAQREAWFDRVTAWTGAAPGQRVLDPGCATGFFALIAAECGHAALGIDLSPDMIDEARRKASAAGLSPRFAVGDATETGLPAASFDVVLERHLLWTLPDPLGAIRHWRELLAPGGRLVSVGVDWRSETESATKGVYTPLLPSLPFYGGRPSADIVALFEQAGFVDIAVESLHDDRYWLDGRNRDRFAVTALTPRI